MANVAKNFPGVVGEPCLGFAQPDINGLHKRDTPPAEQAVTELGGCGGPDPLKEEQSQGPPANQLLKILQENRILQLKGMCSCHHPRAFLQTHAPLCGLMLPSPHSHFSLLYVFIFAPNLMPSFSAFYFEIM